MKNFYTLITLLFATTVVAQDLVIIVEVPPGTTQCRMSGPWWGWDPAGGPVGVDNGNDTFTFTFSPAPGADMEYLYTLDATNYENLIDNASGGLCADRATNGNINTDYANYANRIWKTSDGLSWNETYDNCRYGILSNEKFTQLELSVFPNPSSDFVKITSAETITDARIYDLGGRLILKKEPNSKTVEFLTNDLSSGLYVLKLNANEREATLKILVN